MPFSQNLDHALAAPSERLHRFAELLDSCSDAALETLAQRARATTLRNFGRTMRLFAPLYLSNECINSCKYCGFSRENAILRKTLDVGQVVQEAEHLRDRGFRSILLVAGEHPKFVSNGYLAECVARVATIVPSVALEVGPMETEEYRPMVLAGAEGLVVYQETYDKETYAELHTSGPKKDYAWRLDTPARAHAAGFRRIGIGALFGLSAWREEALALAAHLEYLQRHCWRAALTVSIPRMRPAAGGFVPQHPLGDRQFVQLLCALRIVFPTVGIVLSTREPARFRNAILPLGITMMSAGSHTEPGGYTGLATSDLHRTVRGKQVEAPESDAGRAEEQFSIADERSAAEVARFLAEQGFDPVWKDWDGAILAAS